MFHALVWSTVLMLVGIWSALAWSVHALGAWALSSAASVTTSLTGSSVALLPDWIVSWIPTAVTQEIGSWAANLSPLLVNLPSQVLTLTNGLSAVMWVIWTVGSLLLVGFGLLAHTLQRRMRRPGLPIPHVAPAFAIT